MKAVNAAQYNIVLKGEVWEHSVPPCSKSAICLLANNESVVTWLSPKDDMDNCLTHIPVILFKGKYWTLSLRMSKCIYRHIRLRKGFNNIQNVHGVQTLRIPQLLLNEKKRTQARFEVWCTQLHMPPCLHHLVCLVPVSTYKSTFDTAQKMHTISKRRPLHAKEPKPLYSTKHRCDFVILFV